MPGKILSKRIDQISELVSNHEPLSLCELKVVHQEGLKIMMIVMIMVVVVVMIMMVVVVHQEGLKIMMMTMLVVCRKV